jgi:hypothetical protein
MNEEQYIVKIQGELSREELIIREKLNRKPRVGIGIRNF